MKLAVCCYVASRGAVKQIPTGPRHDHSARRLPLQVTGTEAAVERLTPLVGKVINPTEESDLLCWVLRYFLAS